MFYSSAVRPVSRRVPAAAPGSLGEPVRRQFYSTDGGGPALNRVQALIITSHPGPSLAITALTTLLAVQAAPHGTGPVLTAPALLAGQLSVGWSNDACDAARDAAAGRTDKPLARGDISLGAVWTAAGRAGPGPRHRPGRRGAVRPGGDARLGLQPRAQVVARLRADVPARLWPAA